jgi:hypothetical protein
MDEQAGARKGKSGAFEVKEVKEVGSGRDLGMQAAGP